MKKIPKIKARAQSMPSWLPSRQWLSESTLAAANEPAAPMEDSPSGIPPDDCKKCRIVFKEPVVTVKWEDGQYNANDNVKTSTGGWSPDYWDKVESPDGANVSKTGTVTFGIEGQTISLGCGVKRCKKCRGSFTLHIVRLQIFYKGGDITDANPPKNAEVGNAIALEARVTPAELQPTKGYAWTITPEVLKDYKDQVSANPVIPFTTADRAKQNPSFHWLTGGDKPCNVTVTVRGKQLAAKTTFKVFRPVVTFEVVDPRQPGVRNQFSPPDKPPNPRGWRLDASIGFSPRPVTPGSGTRCWVQTIDSLLIKRIADNGKTLFSFPPSGLFPALDEKFPYSSITTNFDTPGTGSPSNKAKSASYKASFVMYLMYRSIVAGSRWVPLAALSWNVDMSCERNGPSTAPVADYVLTPGWILNYSPASHDETSPPNWKRILQLPD